MPLLTWATASTDEIPQLFVTAERIRCEWGNEYDIVSVTDTWGRDYSHVDPEFLHEHRIPL